MEIILLERIDRLGQMGDIVTVKNGYAHNYLLPQKKALRKTKDNMAYFESKRKEYEAHNLKLKSEAEDLSKKMEGLSVVIIRQAAETGQLYGSVTVRDIADAISEAGFKVERRQIDLNQPIKNIGVFDIALVLHPDVSQNVRVNIARTADDAKKAEKKHMAKGEKEEVAVAEVTAAPAEETTEEKPVKKPRKTKAQKEAEEAAE
ncbi:MAG: 50S ribosomal protein L9 [Lactobacillales bacterium]|jgi:large subunit ribosomal protein L9|nr:50S ribosomal protein L9 [Lactobacillales bacterium]